MHNEHVVVKRDTVTRSPAEASLTQSERRQDETQSFTGNGAAATFGRTSPLGATVTEEGVNFSLYSRTARAVELLLFESQADATPSRVIPLDPVMNRTYHYWHVLVPGLRAGQLYGYRVAGPTEEATSRFDAQKGAA